MLDVYGLTEGQAFAWEKNPVDNPAPLAKAGGTIRVIRKPGADHHPHSLKDPAPIVDFVLKAVNR